MINKSAETIHEYISLSCVIIAVCNCLLFLAPFFHSDCLIERGKIRLLISLENEI